MKNKILKLMAVFIFSTFALTGCGEQKVVSVNVENNKEFNEQNIGTKAMVVIGNSLYYDLNTKIVYWWNGSYNVDRGNLADVMPTPYLAPNGLPYRYNVETNTFEEIKED